MVACAGTDCAYTLQAKVAATTENDTAILMERFFNWYECDVLPEISSS